MSSIRKKIFVVGELGFILAGFVVGLIGGENGEKSSLWEAAIGGGLAIWVMPWLMILLFRLNIMLGFFKPPWEPPRLLHIPHTRDNILPYFQLLAFVFAAMGIGSFASILWRGFQALPEALFCICCAIAVYRSVVRTMAFCTPRDTETPN